MQRVQQLERSHATFDGGHCAAHAYPRKARGERCVGAFALAETQGGQKWVQFCF
jgi:hypothetical protein